MSVSRIDLLMKNRRFQFFMGIVVLIILTGIIGPFFTADPRERVGKRYEPPSSEHILGTDAFGRDVLAQMVYGIRNSIMIGFLAGLIGLLVGAMIGGLSGYISGIFDDVTNTIANIFLVLPTIPILIVLASILRERSIFLVAGIIAFTSWAGPARALRSQVLSLKTREFVNLARLSGKSKIDIVLREIFPNMLSYILITFCEVVGGAMISEAGISMLGLGPTTVTSLGSMLHWSFISQAPSMGAWWWFVPPGVVLVIFVGSLIMVASVIDDVFNPRLQKI